MAFLRDEDKYHPRVGVIIARRADIGDYRVQALNAKFQVMEKPMCALQLRNTCN